MQFYKGALGYLKLGIIFTIFGVIPGVIISVVGIPILFGGTMAGGLTGLSIGVIIVIVIFFIVQGWFLYWFYENNRFSKRGQ